MGVQISGMIQTHVSKQNINISSSVCCGHFPRHRLLTNTRHFL